MAKTIDFPPLRLAVLNGMLSLKERMVSEPELLDSPDCPYDAESIDALKQIFEVQTVERIVEKVEYIDKRERGRPRKVDGMSAEDLQELDEEVKGLLSALKDMSITEGTLETSERVAIMRIRASLIDQALKNKERVLNMKNMAEFQNVVIGVLDDLMTEEMRDAFLDRIEPYRE